MGASIEINSAEDYWSWNMREYISELNILAISELYYYGYNYWDFQPPTRVLTESIEFIPRSKLRLLSISQVFRFVQMNTKSKVEVCPFTEKYTLLDRYTKSTYSSMRLQIAEVVENIRLRRELSVNIIEQPSIHRMLSVPEVCPWTACNLLIATTPASLLIDDTKCPSCPDFSLPMGYVK